MGAVGDGAALPFLNALVRERRGDGASETKERPSGDPIVESAVLAMQRIEEAVSAGRESLKPPPHCPFVSVDPAPAFPEEAFAAEDRMAKLSEILWRMRRGLCWRSTATQGADRPRQLRRRAGHAPVVLAEVPTMVLAEVQDAREVKA